MRFSAVTAFCAAPLALAGTLQQDLVARGAMGVEVGPPQGGPSKQNNQKSNSNDNNNQKSNNNNNYNGGGNGNTVLIQQSQINEIVVIWVNNGGGAATSTVTDTVTVTAAGGAQGTAGAAAAVATHQVTVGGAAGLVYSPESVVAAVGDMVVFTFMASNHTVTQSAFAEPCKKLPTGMDSGFMANINNTVSPPPQMAMQVTVATPIWFYCRQSGHCGKGMTFSINPTANKTQAEFKQMAIAQNGTGTSSPITGGTASGAAPPPPAGTQPAAAAPPPPAGTDTASGSMVSGTGSLNSGGACECACLCGTSAFPNSALQGLGAFGGLSGSMPMAALEA